MTELFDAIENGDLRTLRKLVRTGIDLGQIDEDSGVAPLAFAAERGRHDIVKILIRAGADPDWGGVTTPLEAATLEGHVEVAAVLIRSSADVNRPVVDGFTPLITAATAGNVEMVRLLLEAGANPRVLDDEGESALSHAEKQGHKEVAEILAKLEGNGHRPPESLSAAIESRDFQRLREILASENGNKENLLSKTDKNGLTPLARAAELGHVTLVKALVEAGADLGEGGAKTPLYCAVENRHDPAASALLEAGADVNGPSGEEATTPIMAAAANGHVEMVRFLLEEGADPKVLDKNGKDALWHAARGGQEQTFALLLPLIKVADRKPATAELAVHVENRRKLAANGAQLIDLMHAGDLEEAKRFLANGLVDPDGFDEEGKTAMMLAARLGRRDILRMLIAAGASFELRDDVDGYTALIHAIYSPAMNSHLTISLLAAAGADLDRPSADGRTPLMHVIDRFLVSESEDIRDFKLLAEPLLHLGADVEATDGEGRTAWTRIRDLALLESLVPAERRKLARITRVLSQNGARLEGADQVDLMNAAAEGQLGRLQDLMSPLSSPEDLDGLALLTVAAASGHWDVVSHLLGFGLDINSTYQGGESILMHAARAGTLPIVEQLLQAGADPKVRNAGGKTAADLARAEGHQEVVDLLGG